jgi:DNA-binding NtrC family response regulator
MSRVLIVEDDLDVRDWIAHCMLQDGDEIRGVPDGRRLRALHAEEPDYRPDLVLMDYALPDTDGVALLEELHVLWPGVPAVFVTVQWTGEVIERIAKTGYERIAKPFNPDDLRAAARRALALGERRSQE